MASTGQGLLGNNMFAKLFNCSIGNFLSIPFVKELHQIITNRWSHLHELGPEFRFFEYGSNYLNITYAQMEKAIRTVYEDMPKLLEEVLEWFRNNWKGKK